MAIGVRRSRVLDVRGLIVQVVVLLVVLIAYIALFVGTVAVLEMAGQPDPSIGVLALVGAVAATSFHPLRVMLRGAIDEILFGDRPDPLDAAARVVDRVGDDPVLALRAIREALVLPYASLTAGGVELASSGTAVTHVRRLALQLGDDEVGEIVVGLRPGDLTLSAGDERVLRIVAPLLAQTLRARTLAADLQTSRGQAIAAIEEERRRLRRDLHDGLGPTLSGIAFTADAARNTLRGQPDSADELLRGLRAEAVTAVGEIRRLVYDMRPPALDELGLVPALRQRAANIRTADGRTMRVSVEAPEACRTSRRRSRPRRTGSRRRPSPTPLATAAPTRRACGSASTPGASRSPSATPAGTVRRGRRASASPRCVSAPPRSAARSRSRAATRASPSRPSSRSPDPGVVPTPSRRKVTSIPHRVGAKWRRFHTESAQSDIDFTPSRRKVTSISRRVVI